MYRNEYRVQQRVWSVNLLLRHQKFAAFVYEQWVISSSDVFCKTSVYRLESYHSGCAGCRLSRTVLQHFNWKPLECGDTSSTVIGRGFPLQFIYLYSVRTRLCRSLPFVRYCYYDRHLLFIIGIARTMLRSRSVTIGNHFPPMLHKHTDIVPYLILYSLVFDNIDMDKPWKHGYNFLKIV